jgi:D-threo-aldose 1-dehydrogenase
MESANTLISMGRIVRNQRPSTTTDKPHKLRATFLIGTPYASRILYVVRSAAQDIVPPHMSRLGFGCGSLYGLPDRRASLELIQVAIDCGIGYFDTARMYGYGEAERILGKFVRRDRERMILTSKVGILPPNRSLVRRLAGRGLRQVHDVVPITRSWIKVPDVWQPRFGMFKLPDVRRSVETSLRALGTDYLDILLLHECTVDDVQAPELIDFLQTIKMRGLIRQFGIATTIEATVPIAVAQPNLTSVVQIASSIWDMNIKRLPQRADQLSITHSIFTPRFRAMMSRLASDSHLAKRWEALTGIAFRNHSAAAQLFLAHAFRLNPGGIVLFSSSSPLNIRSNSKFATVTSAQVDGLMSFFEENRPSGA